MDAWVEVPARRRDEVVAVLLDGDDYLRLKGRRLSIASHGYAQVSEQGKSVLLHRWILGLRAGDRLIGDHRNGDPLDNRRANLRVVSPSGSSQNVRGRGKSGHRGVHLARSGRWVARVKFRGKTHICGTYDTKEAAAAAADAKRRELMPFYEPSREHIR